MIEETYEELRDAISKAHDALKREMAKIRTGRANPAILDSVRVDYFGTPTPLKQLAAITVPEARLIVLKPFDKSQTPAIERAINTARLGLNPSTTGDIIRVPMPPLTEERRKDYVKVAKAKGEESKVAIRKARHDAKDMIDELEKSKEISEDDKKRALKKIEEIVKAGSATVETIVAKKEVDILEV